MDSNKLIFLLRCIFRTLFVMLNNVYCIPTYVVWMMMLLPLKKYHPQLYWRIEGLVFHWLLSMVTMWSWSAGYDIAEMGDDVSPCFKDKALIIANHQSTSDVPLMMASYNAKRGVLPNVMWVMDRLFKFTNFGIVSALHGDFFIVSGKDRRDETVKDLTQHLLDVYVPLRRRWLVLFPEGGFLRKRRETSQRYALKNNLPVLQYVSLPRMGAMHAILSTVGPTHKTQNTINDKLDRIHPDELKWLIDVTVAYPDGKPLDLLTIVTGSREPCQTIFFYRVYPVGQVPLDPDAMTKWLYKRFEEKEQMLDAYYKSGVFPANKYSSDPITPRVVIQDPLRFILLHLFFITSTYIHYLLFRSILHLVL